MSHRPIHKKKLARLEKAVNRRPLQSHVDLVQWLLDHGHANTKRKARELLVDGKVKTGSHVIGREQLPVSAPLSLIEEMSGKDQSKPKMEWVPRPIVRSEWKNDLRVEA